MASLSIASLASSPRTAPPLHVPSPTAHTPAISFVPLQPRSFQTSLRFIAPGRPHVRRPVAIVASQSSRVASKPDFGDDIAEIVKEAEEVCAADENSGECAAAWDNYEEISAAKAHKRVAQQNEDPLEKFCKEVPESEECKVYDN